MQVLEWFIGISPPSRSSWRMWFGHVKMWGYTEDETWVFIDVNSLCADILVVHRHDDVERLLTDWNLRSGEVYCFQPGQHIKVPIFPPMNCAVFCAHVLGLRAWTPAGLRRTLRRHGAVEVKHGR